MRDETRDRACDRRRFRPRRRMSRRTFLRNSGRGGRRRLGAVDAPPSSPRAASARHLPGASGAEPGALPSAPAGALDFANWPLYIDIDEDDGQLPDLVAFDRGEGIDVTYTEAINDNEEFFGTSSPTSRRQPAAVRPHRDDGLDDREDGSARLPRGARPVAASRTSRRTRSTCTRTRGTTRATRTAWRGSGGSPASATTRADRARDHDVRRPARSRVRGQRRHVQRDAGHDVA